MSTQPRALELADALDSAATVVDMGRPPEKRSTTRQAAAELRRLAAVEQERDRLHALNAELLEALRGMVLTWDAYLSNPAHYPAYGKAQRVIKKATEAA